MFHGCGKLFISPCEKPDDCACISAKAFKRRELRGSASQTSSVRAQRRRTLQPSHCSLLSPLQLHRHHMVQMSTFPTCLRNGSQSDLEQESLDIALQQLCIFTDVESLNTIETNKKLQSIETIRYSHMHHNCAVQVKPLTSESGISCISPHWLQDVSPMHVLDLSKCNSIAYVTHFFFFFFLE